MPKSYNNYPRTARNRAAAALKHKEKNGTSCGTPVGWRRASQISKNQKLTLSVVKRTFSFLSRAKTYDQGKFTDDKGKDICGSIMYAAWGGDSMKNWAERIIKKSEERSQVGEVDGKPVFDNPAEALAHAEKIGCIGYHEHDLNGSTVYMACANHNEALENKRAKRSVSSAVEKGLKNKMEKHNKSVTAPTKKATMRMLKAVFRRGIGAYKTNPQSVRPSVKSPEQWAYARVSSFLYALKNERFRSGKHDTDLFPKGHKLSSKK